MTKPTTILILIILSLLCLSPACYAKVRYVNTASVGGDGTTNNLTGATAAYKSLFDWEAAEDGIPLTEPMTVYCEGTAADRTAVDILSWNGNSADNYIKITTTEANRHNGKWDDTKYRLVVSGSTIALRTQEPYVYIEGLQIHQTGSGIDIVCGNYMAGKSLEKIYISDNILRGNPDSTWSGLIRASDLLPSTIYIWNNIIYDGTGVGMRGINVADTDITYYIYNNTIYNCYWGIYVGDGVTAIAKNNLVTDIISGSNTYGGTFSAGTDYNSTDADDDIGTGDNNLKNQTFSFADEDGDDFRLSSSDTGAKDQGTDLSNDSNLSFSDDIQGQSRPWGGSDSWDIGADEASPGAGVRIEGATKIGAY